MGVCVCGVCVDGDFKGGGVREMFYSVMDVAGRSPSTLDD